MRLHSDWYVWLGYLIGSPIGVGKFFPKWPCAKFLDSMELQLLQIGCERSPDGPLKHVF